MLVVPDVGGGVVVCSVGDVRHCVGSLSLDSSDAGRGTRGSSSDDSAICSSSKGRLSPLNSCMLGHVTLRYGFFNVLLCLSSCQSPPYKVTALVFFPNDGGGLKRRMLYPLLFLWSKADTVTTDTMSP
jgi:hypothetical protein